MPFILIFAIMYFLIIRPQQKRLKAHREMVTNVKRGDTVVTAGGLVGKVYRVVDDDEIQVDIADGVRVNVVRNTLSEVRPKGEVRGAAKASKQPEKKTAEITQDNEAPKQEDAAASAKSANGAAKKPAARKSRATSSTGARKTASSTSAKSGTSKSTGSKSTSPRTRRSSARPKSGNGASTDQSQESGGDNV